MEGLAPYFPRDKSSASSTCFANSVRVFTGCSIGAAMSVPKRVISRGALRLAIELCEHCLQRSAPQIRGRHFPVDVSSRTTGQKTRSRLETLGDARTP